MSGLDKFLEKKTSSCVVDGVTFKLEAPNYEKGRKLLAWALESFRNKDAVDEIDVGMELLEATIIEPDISGLSKDDVYRLFINTGGFKSKLSDTAAKITGLRVQDTEKENPI